MSQEQDAVVFLHMLKPCFVRDKNATTGQTCDMNGAWNFFEQDLALF
jgi:hypothetical protein